MCVSATVDLGEDPIGLGADVFSPGCQFAVAGSFLQI